MPGIADIERQLPLVEERVRQLEPRVRALLPEADRFARLRREAQRLADSADRSPLVGALAGVKDIFQLRGFVTRAGCRLPAEELQGEEGPAVRALREAGVLFLGKTVTTEFAYFAPGPTTNPHNPAHTPGGSSSGSAAAVAAGYCHLAMGTQTVGSIIRPAAFCGVVGFKPTYDRISREGVLPLSPSADHVGFFAADVASAEIAARVLCRDWSPAEPPRSRPVLGVPLGPYLKAASDCGRSHYESVRDLLRQLGFDIREVAVMDDFDAIRERHMDLVAAEAWQVHERWFARYGNSYHPKTVALLERGRKVGAERLQAARRGCSELRVQLMDVMNAAGIDAWIAPAACGPAPRGLESTGDPIMNLPWTHAGVPVVGLPAGRSADGLPLGVQLAGREDEDEALLQMAQVVEASLS